MKSEHDAGEGHPPEHGHKSGETHGAGHGHSAEHGHKSGHGHETGHAHSGAHSRQEGEHTRREGAPASKATHGHPPEHRHQAEHVTKAKKRTVVKIVVIAVVVLLVLFIVGFLIRHARVSKRESMAKEMRDKPPVVQVVKAQQTQKSFDISLPADVRAFATTALYARTNGYLASWKADINDRVRKGDLLAVISAPDTDAELEQAEAALSLQQANHALTVATEERYRGLIAIRGVTQEQLDQNHAAQKQAAASVASAAATVDQLRAEVGFERIVAPFDGVVTARNYDVGALISAANIAPGQELYDLAEDDMLRVFVNVPQELALLIKYRQSAALVFERNYPGHRFVGSVQRSSGSLDPVTRTLRLEIDFRNNDPAYHIFPGMFGEAILTIHRDTPVLLIPTSALLFEAEGKQVAIVTADNKIHFQPIVPGSDFGTEMEITSGLKGDERIVANPGEELTEGIAVTVSDGNGDGGQGNQNGQGGQKQGDDKGNPSSGNGGH